MIEKKVNKLKLKQKLVSGLPVACVLLLFLTLGIGRLSAQETKTDKEFRAGAAMSVITPKIGTSINGNFQEGFTQNIHDETHARGLVLDDGKTKIAIVTLDLCMAYRETLDNAKKRAAAYTGIPVVNMLISAIHTHSGGTACAVFGSTPDPDYLVFLEERAADAIIRANNNLEPARIGWGVGQEPSEVFNRRWKLKDGITFTNPFGGEDKVRMNPGFENPDLVGPAGPIDPEVPIIAVQSLDGKPIAVLANYSLHYVGGTKSGDISADYFGMFADRIGQMVGADHETPNFVGIMTNGTSGDINNINFGESAPKAMKPYEKMGIVANTVAAEAYKVYQKITYHDWVPLASAQKEISLRVRKPDAAELKRAKKILAEVKGEKLLKRDELYARETVLINDFPDKKELILQAIQIGDLAITAVPCEIFVEIGLEIKEKSPFEQTFSISLANGYNGYLPTPKHHEWGGYETWRARSSYLEVNASNVVISNLLGLLDQLKSSAITSR